MFKNVLKAVTSEIVAALNTIQAESATELVLRIMKARRIVLHGAGRVGLACKGFGMRLGHLGREAHVVGDSTIPPIGKEDLLIVASSSGETQNVYDVVVLAKQHDAHVIVITAMPDSRIAKLGNSVILIEVPTKFSPHNDTSSIQPMASLFEQCLQVFFDVVVLSLMKETQQKHEDLWARHTNLD